jgi:hypothetical protein
MCPHFFDFYAAVTSLGENKPQIERCGLFTGQWVKIWPENIFKITIVPKTFLPTDIFARPAFTLAKHRSRHDPIITLKINRGKPTWV